MSKDKIEIIKVIEDEESPFTAWRLDQMEEAGGFFSYVRDNIDVGTKFTVEVAAVTPEEWKEIEEFDGW